jgi:hypothetical protein
VTAAGVFCAPAEAVASRIATAIIGATRGALSNVIAIAVLRLQAGGHCAASA